ncbi:MAG: hypothetical protein EPO01_11445 [Aquabacterium sp.]|nr:MAG: hypothetical protein EPO01_11445 [Aquabacterium sp.]
MFDGFLKAFPVEEKTQKVNVSVLKDYIEGFCGVMIPPQLLTFWEMIGCGYFGRRSIYFFGSEPDAPRESLQDWNGKDFWRKIYPPAIDGGPVFFAETCFGDQLGFRWDDGRCKFLLFCVDTFDAFVVATDGRELFDVLLTDQYALMDERRYLEVRSKLGGLEAGMHYAPIVSPVLGGSGEAINFAFEKPNAHFRTALATIGAIKTD